MTTFTIFSDATATGSSSADYSGYLSNKPFRTFQAYGNTTSGAGAATILIEVSNDNTYWKDIATISLTLGTAVTNDVAASNAAWPYVRGRISAISGTGAKVSLTGSV